MEATKEVKEEPKKPSFSFKGGFSLAEKQAAVIDTLQRAPQCTRPPLCTLRTTLPDHLQRTIEEAAQQYVCAELSNFGLEEDV